jgi:predicted metal-dependent hydrolase
MPQRSSVEAGESGTVALQFELPLFARGQGSRGRGAAGEFRSLQLGTQILEYALKRSKRHSIGFVIHEGGLAVTAPHRATVAQIECAIAERERWIIAKTAELRERRKLVPSIRWEDGGSVPYFGGQVSIRVVFDAELDRRRRGPGPRFEAATSSLGVALHPSASALQLQEAVRAWLHAEARRIFAERLEIFAARLGVRFQSFRLSSATTRWGSCSANGRILLSWRLIHFPLSSIDYVIAHELAHLKEMNHGPRFWSLVAEVLPGFEFERARMRKPPPALLPAF